MPLIAETLSFVAKNKQRIVWTAAGSAGLALLLMWLWQAEPPAIAPQEGSTAPALELADLSGKPVSLLQYRGQVVLVDFWATWCDACIEEMPGLKRLYAQLHNNGFELLAASLDEGSRKVLVPFVSENKLPWQVLLGNEESVRAYAVFGLPMKYLIDQNGIIAHKYIGWVDASRLQRDIQALLNKETRAS